MPELPEVETIRRDLEATVMGRRFSAVHVSGTRTVRRQPVEEFTSALKGGTITGTRRLGKFLVVDVGDLALMIHLRMSGQLLWHENRGDELRKHTHARLMLEGGGELRFVDPRTFGELWVTTPDLPELAHIGPDALTDLPDIKGLAERMAKRRSGLKTLLLNQSVLAGIGNIYSDEILWAAKLRLDRTPDSLSRQAWQRLHDAIGEVLTDGVEHRGTSMADEQYRDLFGNVGGALKYHKVFAREGQPCFRCKKPVRKTKVQGRGSYWCPGCQR